MSEIKYGFEPVFDENSEVLILGSFPSVKSRAVTFYYGNKQNKFWKTLCSFFGEEIPAATEDKIEFLLRRKVALWDIVTECEIDGSKDDTIRNYRVANLEKVLQNSKIRLIIANGGKAYDILSANYKDIGVEVLKLPSTSPANTRFKVELWSDALSRIVGRT